MTAFRQIFRASLSLPLALAIAACGGDVESDSALEGEPIAAIAAPDGTSWTETVTVSEADGYVLGNPDAPIKLVEYGSLTCPACAQFAAQGYDSLKGEYITSGVVSFELRNQVHNALDLTLARIIRCSAPESFHPLATQVWANLPALMEPAQTNPAIMESAIALPPEQRYVAIAQGSGFLEFFAARGISVDQAAACLSDAASVDVIGERSQTQSQELGINSTPTFILNGEQLDDRAWPQVEAALQRAGARPE